MLKHDILQSLEDQINRIASRAQFSFKEPAAAGFGPSQGFPGEVLARSVIPVYRSICGRLQTGDASAIKEMARAYETILDCSPVKASQVPQAECDGIRLRLKPGHRSERKASGSFYTPDRIIRYIVSSTLRPVIRGECRSGDGVITGEPLSSREILRLKVLDPAMGSGLFLIAAAEYLGGAYRRALVREGKACKRSAGCADRLRHLRLVVGRCVYGVDINRVTVRVARLLLQALSGEDPDDSEVLTGHLKCGDALRGAPPGWDAADYEALPTSRCKTDAAGVSESSTDGPFHWEAEFPDVFPGCRGSQMEKPGFDVVIGNPPYLSYSGRQRATGARDVIEAHRALGMAKGWVTAHGLFMMRSVALARSGGLVSMVVPDQVGHLAGYGPVRTWMLEHGNLLEVRYWGEGVFEDAITPSLTFVVRALPDTTGKTPASTPETSGAAQGPVGSGPEPSHSSKITPAARGPAGRRRASAVVILQDGRRARYKPKGDDEWYASPWKAVVGRLRKHHATLDCFSDPGVHTGNAAGRLILAHEVEGAVPVLEGRQVHPFHCDRPVKWLNVKYVAGPGEYFRIASRSVYGKADLVLRQTADRPIAARHIYHCHFRNSVLALRVPVGFSVEYLLGILNSEAACWLYRISAFESHQRAFPQVKIGRLKALPIPDPTRKASAAHIREIEAIVRKLESPPREHPESTSSMLELNNLVWDLYGLKGRPDPR
jgi:hypothetical protein